MFLDTAKIVTLLLSSPAQRGAMNHYNCSFRLSQVTTQYNWPFAVWVIMSQNYLFIYQMIDEYTHILKWCQLWPKKMRR